MKLATRMVFHGVCIRHVCFVSLRVIRAVLISEEDQLCLTDHFSLA